MGRSPILVLASASPRRREILVELDLTFRCVPADVDETLRTGESPESAVIRLAILKARAAAALAPDADLILGADTLVVAGKEILGKPIDRADAARILRLISGDRHRVLTGVALLETAGGEIDTEVVSTEILMRPLSDREISDYVDSGEADGKAGAYAIQETADRFVTMRTGSFSNVVGLPRDTVAAMLARRIRPGAAGIRR